MAENYAVWLARQTRLERSGVPCDVCEELFVSERGIRAHKQRGGCHPVMANGARDRVSRLLADYIAGQIMQGVSIGALLFDVRNEFREARARLSDIQHAHVGHRVVVESTAQRTLALLADGKERTATDVVRELQASVSAVAAALTKFTKMQMVCRRKAERGPFRYSLRT